MTGDPLAFGAEFPPQDLESWQKTAEATLKGKPLSKLTTTTLDGVSLAPLYTGPHPADEPAGLPGFPPYTRGRIPMNEPWSVMQVYADPNLDRLTRTLETDLDQGVQAVVLQLDSAPKAPQADQIGVSVSTVDHLTKLLRPVANTAAVFIETDDPFGPTIALVAAALASLSSPEKVRGGWGADPLAAAARSGRLTASWTDTAAELADLAHAVHNRFKHVRAVRIDARPYHEAGATDVQELASILATQVAYLRALTEGGLTPTAAAGQLEVCISLDADFFAGIAKLRATRRLLSRVLEACGVAPEARAIPVYVTTSRRMMTQRDPWVNILRTTVASFAGAVGGADGIAVLPFDRRLGVSHDDAYRIARNTQTILREESFLASVLDPAGGSWFVEQLTEAYCQNAWSQFQDIERDGGMVDALTSGRWAAQIADAWTARSRDLAKRKMPITGVSEFPHITEAPLTREPLHRSPNQTDAPNERPLANLPASGPGTRFEAMVKEATAGASAHALNEARGQKEPGPSFAPLPRRFLATAFETLRDESDAYLKRTGTRPKVLLVNLGSIAQHNARAGFAKNFFEAAGIETVSNAGLETPEAAATALTHAGTHLAVFCGIDDAYPEAVPRYAPALQKAGASHLMLAGRPGEHEDTYRKAGVETFIYIGCNVLDILSSAMKTFEVRS